MSNIRNSLGMHTAKLPVNFGTGEEGKSIALGIGSGCSLSFLNYEIISKLPRWKLTSDLILNCVALMQNSISFKSQVIKRPSDLEKPHHRTLPPKLTWILDQAKILPICSITLLWPIGRKLRKFLWVFGMYDPFINFNTLKFSACL